MTIISTTVIKNPLEKIEIASKYCISDSFADYEGYSISSKGFLSSIIDIMVIYHIVVYNGL